MLYLTKLLVFIEAVNSLYYDDYDQFGIGDFDHMENATIIDLSVNSSTPYQDDKAFFGDYPGQDALPDDVTLEDLLSGEGFDLRYTNEQRFQKLRQFRRLVRFCPINREIKGQMQIIYDFSLRFILSATVFVLLTWFNMVVGVFHVANLSWDMVNQSTI